MVVSEYRELIDAVFSKVASCKSAATPEEFRLETNALQTLLDSLELAVSPRSTILDQTRAANAKIAASAIIKERLWQEYDNQNIEEMERSVRQ